MIYDSQTFITEKEAMTSLQAKPFSSSLLYQRRDPLPLLLMQALHGGKRSKLVQFNQREQPPRIFFISKLSPYSALLDYMDVDVWNLSVSHSSSNHSLNLSVELEPNSSPSFL